MQTTMQRKTLLYPLLVIAAVLLIIFAGLGIASFAGWLPQAQSNNLTASNNTAVPNSTTESNNVVAPNDTPSPQPQTCTNCGVIETVTPYTVKGSSSGLGVVAGGVVGGLLGHTIGAGTGNILATVVGAGGGAYAGNEIEKNANKHTRYKLTVRLNDGSTRVFHESSSSWRPGDQVRVNGDHLAVAN